MEAEFCSIADLPDVEADAAVVVDVLRAFTVAPWVLERGARSLRLAGTDEVALTVKAELGPDAVAVKDGPPVPGFELGNSPGQVREADLAGRDVVQRTTNGTVGVMAAAHLPLVLCTGLVTVSATARQLLAAGVRRVALVVSGEGGHADEDIAAAEAVLAVALGRRVSAEALAARVTGSHAASIIAAGLAEGRRGLHPADVALCAELDRFDTALVAHPAGDHVVVEAVTG